MSRRAAETEIEAGHVRINGHVAQLGDKIDPHTDLVTFHGKKIEPRKAEYTYIMLNKPRGYLTSTKDPQGRRCVTDLLEDLDARVYPIGRLDKVSEGLLLLTDDGDLASRLIHPSHTLGKLYRVKVAGQVSAEQLATLSSPMVLDGYQIQPVKVVVAAADEDGTVLKMTLFEGRNRQIRKMCEQVGLQVKRLSRISVGNLKLNGLPVGQWRHLTPDEVVYLRKNTK